MSLASVLVMSAKGRRFSLKVLASACAAACRFLPSAVLQQVERRLDGQRLAADLEAQRGDGVVILTVPSGIAGHRFLVEQFLDPVLELVGLVLAHVLEPRPVVTERGIAHRLFQHRVVDAVELEREEQEMQRRGGEALLHVAIELGAGRIGRIAGVDQRRIGADAAEPVVERFEARNRNHERRALPRRHVGKHALVGLLEGDAFAFRSGKIARKLRAVHPRIEIGEVPFRQRAEFAGGRLGRFSLR